MSAVIESRPIALELHRLLKDIDPSRWRDDVEGALRARADELAERFAALRAQLPSEPLAERASAIAELLRERIPQPGLPPGQVRDAWAGFRAQLSTAYEAFSLSLREEASVVLPQLRPTNYTRSLVHAASAISVVLLIEEVLSAELRLWVPLAATAMAWSMEAARHFTETGRRFLLWLFGPIAHPHEHHRINSSTWFTTALAILGAFFAPAVAASAVIVLGLADPAAGLVGRRWGRTKLVHQRSLEGTLAFVAVGTAAALGVLSLWHGDMTIGARLLVAFAVALSGGIAELFSNRVDDNFSIPVVGSFGGALAMGALSFFGGSFFGGSLFGG